MKYLASLSFLFLFLLFFSCNDNYVPKPVGLFRIDIPAHDFLTYDIPSLPYSFLYADYAQIQRRFDKDSNWVTIVYPQFKASLFLTYHSIDTALSFYIEDCHQMAFKHTAKASNIETERIANANLSAAGLVYLIQGDHAASPLNFYITDSTHHFLRGALYFNLEPRNDSLRPVILSIENDLRKLINSLNFR